eukprot:CAMPEP_0182428692 /NCGR_PEP_ID=MMETSP1167-20130531/23212_1 /TAXON_ID=2988 /ORGANISM="Mallomonas Sp, Strain CCMP3275" /LENGTH=285 /DNA_ID=CAMNT_0024611725 /DNA_START=66 /DNA_END=923 /DNA_ORIENTATION=-
MSVKTNPNAWSCIIEDANDLITREPLMRSMIQDIILSRKSLKDALSYQLAKLCAVNDNDLMPWVETFRGLYDPQVPYTTDDADLEELALFDLSAVYDRDPSCDCYLTALLYFKGFKALQGYRAANVLYNRGRVDLALLVQSRCSEVYGVDIHPAANIGRAFYIDHGTGVVIGETARIGKNCSILHNVTLGSTGKGKCVDRHPKIGDDVLIGCNASILGNIAIGDNCKIGAGSIVIKPIPAHTTAVGNPARAVGVVTTSKAGTDMDLGLRNVRMPCGTMYCDSWDI